MIEKGERFRCFDCYHNNSYEGGGYCGNKKRLRELNIDNVFFSPKYDGDDCDYYLDEEEYLDKCRVKWKIQKFLKGFYDMIEKWKFAKELRLL